MGMGMIQYYFFIIEHAAPSGEEIYTSSTDVSNKVIFLTFISCHRA